MCIYLYMFMYLYLYADIYMHLCIRKCIYLCIVCQHANMLDKHLFQMIKGKIGLGQDQAWIKIKKSSSSSTDQIEPVYGQKLLGSRLNESVSYPILTQGWIGMISDHSQSQTFMIVSHLHFQLQYLNSLMFKILYLSLLI